MKFFTSVIIIFVAAVIVIGFFIIDSPGEERVQRFDERRISDLQSLEIQVFDFWQQEGQLPNNLDFITKGSLGGENLKDPETGENYEYIVEGENKFSLCAVFGSSSEDKYSVPRPIGYPVGDGVYSINGGNWVYEPGRRCFVRTITKTEAEKAY